MADYDISKFKLKFDKPRKQKPAEEQSEEQSTTEPSQAAKKRWWQIGNLGMDIGSNKKDVSKDNY